MFDEDSQIAVRNYCGQILHHLPLHVSEGYFPAGGRIFLNPESFSKKKK